MLARLWLSWFACTGVEGDPGDPFEDSATPGVIAEPAPAAGRLLIAEVYYAGSPPLGGADHYFSDQFVALVNASDVPVLAGGLLIGDAFGLAGEINPGFAPDAHADDPERVYLQNVWRIPGAPEDVVVAPGDTLVLAHDGTNHVPFSTLDLSGADFEAFVASSGEDADSPTVANLEEVHFTGGYDWLVTVFGPTVVVLAPDTRLQRYDEGWIMLRTASVGDIVDAVEALMDADSAAYKRLPDSVDAGFVHVSGTYTGESVRRRIVDGEWQDTDDSSADFELSVPRP